jgi:hypothetical protein
MSSVWPVMQAIYNHWNSSNLNTYVAGGLWANIAPNGTAYPFAVYDMISSPVSERARKTATTMTWIYNTRFQIVMYDDNLATLGAAAEKVREAFDLANLVLLGNAGTVLQCKYVNELPRKQDEEVWQWMLEYEIQREATVIG